MKDTQQYKLTHQLQCLECDTTYEDDYTLNCNNNCNSLLRPIYDTDEFQVLEDQPGLFRYKKWLPVSGTIETESRPITYKSIELAEYLGLENLLISFNGYWPERDAYVTSCSFKEYEAYPTLQRMKETIHGVVQVSSAGNTARAFAHAASRIDQKIVLVVPKDGLSRLWSIDGEHDHILLVAIEGDYLDAIEFGKKLTQSHDMIKPEGGAKNIARRAGMGLVMLDAVNEFGKIPDYYFQGVGSGTGGIAAFEAANQLINDGTYGDDLPQFHLVQNLPFIPMVNAWNSGRDHIIDDEDMENARENVKKVKADLLTNRQPPYAIRGGVYDVLSTTNGKMSGVTNQQLDEASQLFEELEGIDIDPAAAVALAALIDEVEKDNIDPEATILLNITGGGYKRLEDDYTKQFIEPNIELHHTEDFDAYIKEIIEWVES